MRKFVMALLALTFMLTLAACDTVKGFGEDVSAGGQDIGDAATAVQNHL